jgi:hypothetical protein
VTTAPLRHRYLIEVRSSGGLCAAPCEPTLHRLLGGRLESSVDPSVVATAPVPQTTLPPRIVVLTTGEDADLQRLWTATTRESLLVAQRRAAPLCPSAADGTDIAITIMLPVESVTLSNCEFDLSTAGQLVDLALAIIERAQHAHEVSLPLPPNPSDTATIPNDGIGWWLGDEVDGMFARVMARPPLPDGRRVLLSVDYETPNGVQPIRCIGTDFWSSSDWNPQTRGLAHGDPVDGLLGPAMIYPGDPTTDDPSSNLTLVVTLGESYFVIRTNCGPPPSRYRDKDALVKLAKSLRVRPLP